MSASKFKMSIFAIIIIATTLTFVFQWYLPREIANQKIAKEIYEMLENEDVVNPRYYYTDGLTNDVQHASVIIVVDNLTGVNLFNYKREIYKVLGFRVNLKIIELGSQIVLE